MSLFKSYKKYNDEELMKFVQEHNYSAFDELHTRYSKRLLHFMFKMLNNDEEKAQDLLQDLFMKIVERPHMFDTSKKFYSSKLHPNMAASKSQPWLPRVAPLEAMSADCAGA